MSDVDALARRLRPKDRHLLRQGIVASIGADIISVRWGGATDASPSQRYLTSYVPRVGDSVYGLRDGDDTIVLGPVVRSTAKESGRRILAYEILDRLAPVQPYAQNSSVVPTAANIPVTTTEGNTGLLMLNIPCPPNRLLRAAFQFFGGGLATVTEWYFRHKVNFNGAGWVTNGESRYTPPAGANGAPMGENIFVTPSTAQTISVGVNTLVLAGTATLYQHVGVDNDFRHSQFYLEDLGQA